VYKVPDFAFLLDDSFERNQKINEVIQREADKLKNK
jgi:ribosome-binding factor A